MSNNISKLLFSSAVSFYQHQTYPIATVLVMMPHSAEALSMQCHYVSLNLIWEGYLSFTPSLSPSVFSEQGLTLQTGQFYKRWHNELFRAPLAVQ